MNYCIYGNESFQLNRKINEILKDVKCTLEEASQYDASDKKFSIEAVIDDAQMISFLTPVKVILVQNSIFLSALGSMDEKAAALLLQYLEAPNPDTIVIFTGKFESMDSRKKLVKSFIKNVRCISCNQMNDEEYHSFVKQALSKAKITLDRECMDELISRLDGTMEGFYNSLDKLLLYGQGINKETIDLLIARPLEEDVFKMVNAVVNKNLPLALKSSDDLLANNKNDELMFIGILAKQFRFLYQCKVLRSKGYSEAQIADKLSANKYRVTKSLDSIYRISLKELEQIILKLAKIEQSIKSGKMDKRIGFQLFIMEAAK